MSLSNTAIPRYYCEFRNAVLRGDIPVNREIEMEMNRIDNLVRNPDYYYDDEAVEGFILYCESELTLSNGDPVKLLFTFKLWAEEIFGWYYFEEKQVYVPYPGNHGGRYEKRRYKKRLVNKQYLIIARSAAKSMYASYIQNYFLNVDPSTTSQEVIAPTMAQAEEIMAPIRTSIVRARGPLLQFLTEGSINNTTGSKADRVKVASTKKGIQNFLTDSIIKVRPMSVEKIQGSKSKIFTIDEWLSCKIREDVVGAAEQGAAKNRDYLILATSSEGTIRNGPGDTIKMELMQILKGEYDNPHVSIWWYKLDDISEVGDPAMWVKANPNIGETVSYETYQLDVERAEKSPFVRNDILAKRFGIPMEGYTYFFAYEETIPHKRFVCDGLECSLGADLSFGDDFCAFTFLFPLSHGRFGVKTRSYISQRTLVNLSTAMNMKYQEFIDEGSLVIMDGSILNLMSVYDDLDEFIIKHHYNVTSFGYDPYNAYEFVERWKRENGDFGVEKVIQGSKTESVPLGEIKILAQDGCLIFDEQIMSFTMGNCVVLVDTNGNRKLWKDRRERKIDNVAALMDAWVARKRRIEAFD